MEEVEILAFGGKNTFPLAGQMEGMVVQEEEFLFGRSRGSTCSGLSDTSGTSVPMMVEGEEGGIRRDVRGRIWSSMFHWERLLRRSVWTVRKRLLET